MIRSLSRASWHKDLSYFKTPQHIDFSFDQSMANLTDPFYQVKQIHSARLESVSSGRELSEVALTEADGLYSQLVGRTLAVKTADCLPVLFYGLQDSFVAAVHAGWRGFSAGILSETLKVFEGLGGRPENLGVLVGPSVSGRNYEVGPEVIEAVLATQLYAENATPSAGVLKGANDRWFLDLANLAVQLVASAGVQAENIQVYSECTFSSANFHSFRREGARMQSNYSWIRLNSTPK